MEIEGTVLIAAPRPHVWRALQDPVVLQAAIPGCHSITGNAEDGFEARVERKIGPVRTTFHGRLLLTEINAPASCVLIGESTGAVAGLAQGRALVQLDEADGGTHVRYRMNADLGGWLERIGSATLEPLADRAATAFFTRVQVVIETGSPPPPRASDAPTRRGWTDRLLGRRS